MAAAPDKTVLPAPEVDITKTSFFRAFAPGSAGPHMDVILFNQITIAKQLQDVRRSQETILMNLHGPRRPAKTMYAKAAKISAVVTDDDFFNAILEASQGYMNSKGAMMLTRSKKFESAVKKWEEAIMADEEVAQEVKEEMKAYSEAEKRSLHIQCTEQLRGKKRESTSTIADDEGDEDSGPRSRTRRAGKAIATPASKVVAQVASESDDSDREEEFLLSKKNSKRGNGIRSDSDEEDSDEEDGSPQPAAKHAKRGAQPATNM